MARPGAVPRDQPWMSVCLRSMAGAVVTDRQGAMLGTTDWLAQSQLGSHTPHPRKRLYRIPAAWLVANPQPAATSAGSTSGERSKDLSPGSIGPNASGLECPATITPAEGHDATG